MRAAFIAVSLLATTGCAVQAPGLKVVKSSELATAVGAVVTAFVQDCDAVYFKGNGCGAVATSRVEIADPSVFEPVDSYLR